MSYNEKNLLIATASEEQAQVARAVDYNLVSIRDLSIQTSAGTNQTATASGTVSTGHRYEPACDAVCDVRPEIEKAPEHLGFSFSVH